MPRDFYPRPEAAIVAFTANLSAKLSAAPLDYGISPEAAAEYAATQQAFAEAYQTVHTPGGNSSTAYAGKETARVALERATRSVVGFLSAKSATTPAVRIELGLKPRAARRKQRPVPDAPPTLHINGTSGSVVRWELIDTASNRRRCPPDASGAVLFGCVGDQPAADRAGWQMMRITSRATGQVAFPSTLPPGTMVWLVAYWLNTRKERGQACLPVRACLSYGVTVERQLTTARQAA